MHTAGLCIRWLTNGESKMANEKKENHKTDAKIKYSSTVFACDLSSDTRYIRCDFPQCSEHGSAMQAKPLWILNTLKNVRTLESHVGKEVHNFMKAQSLHCIFSDTQHKIESQNVIESGRLPIGTKKVLAVFNLKDPQSQLGEWLNLFLKAAFLAEYGDKRQDFVVITQDFVSRYELMQCISRLEFLKSYSPKIEVVGVLSSHSSCQGQVFSCTPTDISKVHGFEEFCSLHDVTLACQDAFGDNLEGLHISSCFTLKLDCSHEDWPVDASWFKNKLRCVLTGSTREVYETGSQICDLQLLITTMLSPPIASFSGDSCGERLRKAVIRAQVEEFPDLAREMGLEVINGQNVHSKLQTQGTDDKVSPPGLVISEVFVALLVKQEATSQCTDNPSIPKILADALSANLSIRKASDIRCKSMVLSVAIDKVSSLKTKSSLKVKLNELPRNSSKVFFVVLSPSLANPSTGLIEVVRSWSASRGGNKIYGVHFQEISALQAFYIKNRLKEEVALSKYTKNVGAKEEGDAAAGGLEHISITGLVDNSDKNPHVALPVLMYLIHLATGENGERLAGKGILSGVYSKKPVGPGTSCWTLEEVYMETCHVLSGLARKCSLQVLSLPIAAESTLSDPVQSAAANSENVSNAVSIPVCTTDEKGVTLHERSPLKTTPTKDSPLSAQKNRRKSHQSVTSTLGTSEISTNVERIQLTPKQERMSSNEVIITKVVQEMPKNDGNSSSPCSRKRIREYGNDVNEESCPRVKKLANSAVASPKIRSRSLSNSSSSTPEQIEGSHQSNATDPPRDAPPCFRNLTDSFEREFVSYSPSFSTKTQTVARSSTYLSEQTDIDTCAANMRSTNKCSGVTKSLLKSAKAFPRSDKKGTSGELSLEVSANSSGKPNKWGNISRTVLDGDEQTGLASMEMKNSLRQPSGNDSASVENLKDPRYSREVDLIDDDDDDGDIEMCSELEESEQNLKKEIVEENSKGIQANFCPLNKENDCANKNLCIKKIKQRLKTQNISSPSSDMQENPKEPRVLLSSSKCKHKSERMDECVAESQPDMNPSFESIEDNASLATRPSEKSQDIPLMANVDEVNVTHYVLDLAVDFEQKVMRGSIMLFLEPANEEVTSNTFQLCLDSTLVNVESVSEVFLPEDFEVPFFLRKSSRNSVKEGSSNTVIRKDAKNRDSTEKMELDSSSKGQELSLFQRLQKNYGIRSTQSTSESLANDNESSRISSESPRINPESSRFISEQNRFDPDSNQSKPKCSRLECESSRIDSKSSTNQFRLSEELNVSSSSDVVTSRRDNSKQNSSLPEFLEMLGAKSCDPLPYKGLTYSVYGWCIKVWKEGATGKAWPRCVCIKYHTSPEGQSLMWTRDQDGKYCVFSPGAYINNRSLMPCQEPPVAMSTWQAAIHVPQGCMAFMSGCPVAVENNSSRDSELVTHYFEMDLALPCSTLALAVGWLSCREGPMATVPTQEGLTRQIPCRIVAAPSLIDKAADQLLHHIHTYVEAACELLGPYPFDRIDLLILPRCFACMGLKSPNLAFLSQSILASDGSLRLRVAHEISHAWFGLLIGAKDWTEEWLSEGFATYMEDTIQSKGEKWLEHQDQQYREIRQILRYRTLSSEMRETEKNMQCLRPKLTKFNVVEMAEEPTSSNSTDQPKPSSIIKYKCSKKWTQVHYLKGYFLLNYLANMVGREKFDRFLYDYVQHYQGQLVNSEDFFEFFVRRFPSVLSQTVESIMEEWLERPGIPKCLRRKAFASKENVVVNRALEEFEFWRRQDTTNKRNRTKNARHRKEPENFQLESSEQIVLMLEKLLERDALLHTTLRQLNKCYQFDTLNAEIRHRWCELVVKHKFTPALKDVRRFLIEDQGMGIYLFGELIISGQGKQRLLAEEIFAEIGDEMDRCTYKTVSDMLEGVE